MLVAAAEGARLMAVRARAKGTTEVGSSEEGPAAANEGATEATSGNERRIQLLLLLVAFLIMFFSSSVKGVFQVNFTSIREWFGVSYGGLAIAGSIFVLATGLGSFGSGYLCDRMGAKWTIALGSAVAGASLIVAAVSSSFIVFVVMFGALGALAVAAMQYVPMGVLVDRVFSERTKGLAYASVLNGTAIGFIVLSPVWVWLNVRYEPQTVFLWLGFFFLLPLTALAAFGLRGRGTSARPDSASARVNWREGVLTSRQFWFLALSFAGCGVNMAFIDIHLVPAMEDNRVTPVVIGSTLSVLGIFELIGGFVAGLLTARFSHRPLLSGFYFVRAMSVLLLAVASSPLSYTIFAAVFGLTYLGTVVLTSLYCLRFFGDSIKGSVFGALWLVHQIGAFIAVALGGLARDAFGDYALVIIITAAISLASAVIAARMPSDELRGAARPRGSAREPATLAGEAGG